MEGSFVTLKNSVQNTTPENFDGLVAMVTSHDGDTFTVELVDQDWWGFWRKRDTEPHPDPRSDVQRLEYAFLVACESLDMNEVRRRYHDLGSPCLREKFYSQSPLDVLYEACEDGREEGNTTPEGIGDLIDFLQQAGSRISSNVTVEYPALFAEIVAKGLKVDHIDYTDLECGFDTILSQTACSMRKVRPGPL